MQDFEQLVRTHADAVHAYARGLSNDPWLAEEAVQVTFMRAWKYQGSFSGEGSYEGWLVSICRNVVFDLTKKRSHDQPLDQAVEQATNRDTDQVSETEIGDLIDNLPMPQREVLMLCGVMGYDYESAAKLLDVPVGTVRSRLHRGRAALSVSLNDVTISEAVPSATASRPVAA